MIIENFRTQIIHLAIEMTQNISENDTYAIGLKTLQTNFGYLLLWWPFLIASERQLGGRRQKNNNTSTQS